MDLCDHEPKIKKIRLKEDEESTTSMENLPREIIIDILSRLPITSLVQFKLVCKTWKVLLQDPLLPSIHASKTAQDSPFLIFHGDFPLRSQLSFVELPNQAPDKDKDDKVKKFHLPFWDSMPEFDVLGSCNGLLCLYDALFKESLCVYNPFTRDFLVLPKSKQYLNQEVVFGFGFESSRMEYKVIKVVYYTNSTTGSSSRTKRITYHLSEVQILTLGTSAWRSLGKAPYQLVRKPSEALVNGRLHWVTRPRRYRPSRLLVAFDLASEQFHEVPKPEGGPLSRFNYQVMVLGGCLGAVVYCNYRKLEIWVMRTYNVKESWVKEFNIGLYLPKGLKQNVNLSSKIWRNVNAKITRVLCMLQTGEILLECRGRALVAYDPKRGKFRDVVLDRLPDFFQTFVHVGCLSWIDTHTHID